MEMLRTRTFAFLLGCFAYSFMEVASRGYTHWTMTLTGGLVLAVLFGMFSRLKDVPFLKKCLLGAMFITAVEFTVGVIVNIILDWNVWDYSDMPFNILGQVCLPFSVIWFLICIPAGFICEKIENRLT